MIPKIIHYCWFGGSSKPPLAEKCIESWKNHFPDFEIKEWNEDNYDVLSAPVYVREAYAEKKWAFVSDYVRFDVVYRFGGIYFDTDVEVIKSFEDILSAGAFMGREDGLNGTATVAAGLGFGCEKGHPVLREILDLYSGLSFRNSDGSLNTVTVVTYVTDILRKHGLKDNCEIQNIEGIRIYPVDYFCPINELGEKKNFSKNTHSIHWYSASWYSDEENRKKADLIRKNKLDKIIHLPNRAIKRILGEDRYEKLKSKIK